MKFFALLLLAFPAATTLASAGTLAQFRTQFGDIDVELYDQDKPVTVRNFIRYAESGAYSNEFFHRCIPKFVVQGGGYTVPDPQSQAAFALTNVTRIQTFPPITNEFNTGQRLSNTYGTIAMAKLPDDPNSATSEWFFNLGNNSTNLDNQNGGFTVFGRVVAGTNLLNFFNTLDKATLKGVVDFRFCDTNTAAGAFSDLPVLYVGPFCPRNADLFYADVTLLNVKVRSVDDGAQEISWNSVSNKLNTVEFTTNFPPVWHSLTVTNGTGGAFKFVDTSVTNAQRFYRVRVDY
jgi:cyclophilin family peptidyl-prolyl cis-trans isomerase